MARLSSETQKKIRDLKGRFPHPRSAVLPALHYAQAEVGHLDDETLVEISRILDLPVNTTTEVVGFYTMFDRRKPGKYKLEVCRNLSCALMGARKVVAQIEDKLGIQCGETTPDGKFTLMEAECLGACGYAPMMMIGPYFYEFLDKGKVDAIVDALARDEKPPVPPAGYFQKDQVEPRPGRDGAVPTASEEIRDRLAVHGNATGKGDAS